MVKDALIELARVLEKLESGEIQLEDVLVALSPEEKSIINVLIEKKAALNLNAIRNILIDDFIGLIMHYRKIYGWQILNKNGEEKTKKPKLSFWEGDFNDDPDLFNRAYEILKQEGVIKNSGKILDRDKERVAKVLKDLGIVEIPTRPTIQKILDEFVAAGLVLKRPDSRSKGKMLYFINPQILKYIKLEQS